jgi:hypothetical protein
MHSLTWYWGELHHLKTTIDAARKTEDRVPLHIGFIFLKLTDKDIAVDNVGAAFNPWLIRYKGQTKRMLEKIATTDWISDIVEYGVHNWAGKYKVMGREACQRITGPKVMRLEEVNEEDWRILDEDDWN